MLSTSMMYKQTVFRQILKRRLTAVVTVPKANNFWEPDRKGGYACDPPPKPAKQLLKEGFKILPQETKKFVEERKQGFRGLSYIFPEHGDFEYFFRFNDSESVNRWIVTCDSTHNEGKSHAEFFLGPNKKGLFKGIVHTDLPEDGMTKRAGYANIKAPDSMKSFFRRSPMDWSDYTHLIMMVRGDGRPYNIMLGMERYFDVQWNDVYSYPLYTHGGPYWQYVKIPFSKFFLNSKGRIQDAQERLDLDKVSFLGITISDRFNGPFQLEIDWIGGVIDETHTEDFAYELYKCSPSVFC